jgi:hypothetical protein
MYVPLLAQPTLMNGPIIRLPGSTVATASRRFTVGSTIQIECTGQIGSDPNKPNPVSTGQISSDPNKPNPVSTGQISSDPNKPNPISNGQIGNDPNKSNPV